MRFVTDLWGRFDVYNRILVRAQTPKSIAFINHRLSAGTAALVL